ncbi:MAG TPA: beta-N-acetylhexosaminidase [Acidiphilium sp.]
MKAAIVGIAGPVLTDGERELLAAMPPAGVILFGRNIQNKAQLSELIVNLRAVLPAEAVLMVDQEGGRVARLHGPDWPELPPAAALGALYATDPDAARTAARAHGAALGSFAREAGFDVVTAPVLDVPVPGANAVIGDRAISTDPVAVGVLGADVAWGLLFQGVQPVMKHMPGHGRATVDSHAGLPRVTAQRLDADLAPFAANADLPWGMTAHIVYECWDAKNPATFSPTVIGEVIRGRIGFRGILVSDDLAMGALDGVPEIRAARALDAGCDLALWCPGGLEANRAVLAVCPDLDPALATKLKARPAT